MNKIVLSLLLLTLGSLSAGTVTVYNNTTLSVDLYEQARGGTSKVIFNKLQSSQSTNITVSANSHVIIQTSATHHWKSPVFIEPSRDQEQRFFELSYCSLEHGFKLKQLSHDPSL
ncbi:MAG: hypothetical protein ACJAZS_000848 [Alteromonas naphthalenivorans]|jgi:hypothetical protein